MCLNNENICLEKLKEIISLYNKKIDNILNSVSLEDRNILEQSKITMKNIYLNINNIVSDNFEYR